MVGAVADKNTGWEGGVSGEVKDGCVLLYLCSYTLRFRSSVEIDPVRISQEFGVEASEVFRVKLRLFEEEVKQPLTVEDLKKILGVTVKQDDVNKVITFLCMLSAYTDSPFNESQTEN